MGTTVRLELFVKDANAFVEFYTRVLGFDVTVDRRSEEHPYVAVQRGSVRIAAAHPWEPVDTKHRALPTGVEIVLEVDDLKEEYQRILDSGWPVADDMKEQPWGLADFRVYDPDGYYIRITHR